jgi:hypothetical protein
MAYTCTCVRFDRNVWHPKTLIQQQALRFRFICRNNY